MQFLDVAGVRQFKQYNDEVYLTAEDIGASSAAGELDFYTKSQINSMLDNLDIPSNTSDLTNDSGFITGEDIGLNDFFDDVVYDSTSKKIIFKNGTTTKKEIDATDFIKDGMVNTVSISTPSTGTNAGKSCLVITFNTDAGKSDIEIPLVNIFNPSNYYDKTTADNTFVAKDGTKVLSTNDYTTTEKNKLASIAEGAQVNVQSDWNATSGDALILNKPTIPAEVTESTVLGWGFTKNAGTITEETDPTVPAWAKAANKPTYTASEVGALPDTTTIPSKTSDLTNDSNFISSETDPVFSASAASGISSSDISNWNGKADAATTLAGYGITDAKIQNGTITLGNNTITPLTAFSENDPIFAASAAYGISSTDISNWNSKQAAINDLADIRNGAALGTTALQSYTETDPVFEASAAANITNSDIANWNSKTSNTGTLTGVTFNGNAATVNNGVAAITATIPTVNNSTISIQKGGTAVDSFTTNASSAKTINIPNELPSYSASNNGQILMVVNGALSWVSPTVIYSGSSTPDNTNGNNGDIYLQT